MIKASKGGPRRVLGEEVVIYGDTALLTGKLAGDAVMEPLGKLSAHEIHVDLHAYG